MSLSNIITKKIKKNNKHNLVLCCLLSHTHLDLSMKSNFQFSRCVCLEITGHLRTTSLMHSTAGKPEASRHIEHEEIPAVERCNDKKKRSF